MGQLISKDSITDPFWYFADARYSSEARGYVFHWPNEQYPYTTSIHKDSLKEGISVKVRAWIELHIQETVIYDTIDHSYRWFWHSTDKSWEKSYEVPNRWIQFHFDNEESLLMFKLAFSGITQDPAKHHPDHPEHEERCNMTPGERGQMRYKV